MATFSELVFDEKLKTMELLTDLSKEADQVLTANIGKMIEAGMDVRCQVMAPTTTAEDLYVEGYKKQAGVYKGLLQSYTELTATQSNHN
ncbi:hypothetical protein [Myroides phaeus]|uniref:Uncharacterized protein n=1 Tax=Myroides phaeus TaxID=702745 RepID=A0A1G8ED05_9FLAO|nr:hypothetical protein [Myroides phaeus]MEC4115964.1 hypothetical protein [Myroides phaeus]SDH67776.1 hypothetical protein SAMN05421818_11048 [Myroides phaeus]